MDPRWTASPRSTEPSTHEVYYPVLEASPNAVVAVDAAAKEVGKILLGHGERSEREALCRREADAHKPVVETAVAPLDSVVKPSVPISALLDWSPQVKASAQRLDLVEILGDEGHLRLPSRKIPVGRH